MPLDPHPLIVNADLSNFCILDAAFQTGDTGRAGPGFPNSMSHVETRPNYPYGLHMYKKQKPCMTHSTLEGIKTTACVQCGRPLSEIQAATCVTTLCTEMS